MNNILFTVCARAGSKRLPGKNIKEFHGKPLIIWTIQQIIDFITVYFGKYNVSIAICTDTKIEYYYDINKFKGIYFMDRPFELSGDDVPKLKVIRYVYNKMKINNSYNMIIDLDVTNPCRTVEDIKNCIDLFIEKEPINLFSVVKSRRTPNFNQIVSYRRSDHRLMIDNLTDDEIVSLFSHKYYDLNSSIYIYSKEFLDLDCNSPVHVNSDIYIMKDWTAFDIDTQTDWDIAEMLFEKHILKKDKCKCNGKCQK